MPDGTSGSVFDALEDLDAQECLEKCTEISVIGPKPLLNSAFVFIKPHAVTDATKALVSTQLAAAGIKVLSEGVITAEVIDEKQLIDQHYCT